MEKITISETGSNFGKHYEDNGYVAIKNIISQKSITRLQNDLISLFSKHFPEVKDAASLDAKVIDLNTNDPSHLHKLQISATKLSSFYSILAEMHDTLVGFFPSSVDIFFSSLGYVLGIPASQRLAYDWHQDGTYHDGENKKTIHLWFPIFYLASLENGAMSVIENSHELGLLDFQKTKLQNGGYTTNKVANTENILKNRRELVCEMDVGDCIFFSDELIHRSNINHTNQCRIAGVLKYSLFASYDTHSGLVGI